LYYPLYYGDTLRSPPLYIAGREHIFETSPRTFDPCPTSRDQIGGAKMTGSQMLDFEVNKRKYANMMDIITFDDLLRRLNHTITVLGG
jgi:hypothetical protein